LKPKELVHLFLAELERVPITVPTAVMLAGPNGAGKSTAFATLLSPLLVERTWDFLNADEVVRDMVDAHYGPGFALRALPPHELLAIQKRVQQQMREERSLRIQAAAPRNFVFETVFSDAHGDRLQELRNAKQAGFFTVMVAVCSDDLDALIERVRRRERQGGHGVDAAIQRARYPRVRANLCLGAEEAGLAVLMDNGGVPAQQGKGSYRIKAVIANGTLLGCSETLPHWVIQILASIAPANGRPHGSGIR